MKKRVAVLFGGQSVEHEVSIITGLQILENVNSTKYDVFPVYIDKNGQWYHGNVLTNLESFKNEALIKKKAKQFWPGLDKKDKKNVLTTADCAIIALHGTYGEDGKLQGLLDFLGLPYTSSGVIGSSAGMDKIIMKKIFLAMDLPVLPYLWLTRWDWQTDQKEWINKIHYTLDYPIFVKPANLGSSIGISMATNENELIEAINIAAEYDHRILVEKGIEKAVEVNCSVLSRKGEVQISAMEEPVKWEQFLSFTDKYIRSNTKGKTGMSGMQRKIPPHIQQDLQEKIALYSGQVYKTLDCKGVVRIDYILNNERDKLFINEINTIPGSFSFYLWEPAGLQFTELIDILIEESFYAFDNDKQSNRTFNADLLQQLAQSKGVKKR